MSDGETISTARLILRQHRPDDLDGYAPLWLPPTEGPPRVPVLDREGAWARLLRLVGHRGVFGFAPWLVTEAASGAIVGEAGFGRFERGVGPGFDHVPEAMWALLPEHRGRGFAREAMAAAIADLDRRIGAPRSVCMIVPDNTASLTLAARLGFHRYGAAERHGRAIDLLERIVG
jgi:RimJ/RimL family protein N-acetyltransferase